MSSEHVEDARFSRSQKFRLSVKGQDALSAFELALAESRRGTGGRAAFDAAGAGWGASLGLSADDARYLAQFGVQGCTLGDAAAALRDYGPSAKDVKATTTRLLKSGILELLPSER